MRAHLAPLMMCLATACGSADDARATPPDPPAATTAPVDQTAPAAAAPTTTPPRKDHGIGTYWIKRTDAELDAALGTACTAAADQDQKLLLQFSAPWCIDCKGVRALSTEAPLQTELQRWQSVVIDVGDFDRHDALRGHFGVAAIAHWVALDPTDCAAGITSLPVLKSGTFEPASGTGGLKTSAELAGWLATARTG